MVLKNATEKHYSTVLASYDVKGQQCRAFRFYFVRQHYWPCSGV